MRGRGRLSSRRISSVESVGSVTIKLSMLLNGNSRSTTTKVILSRFPDIVFRYFGVRGLTLRKEVRLA